MAEAVVNPARNRFYCHQCSAEINPTLPQYTCPQCDNGFIEEITEDFDGSDDDPVPPPGPGLDLGELWGRQFLDSFRQHATGSGGGSGQTANSGRRGMQGGSASAPAATTGERAGQQEADDYDGDDDMYGDDLLPGFMMPSFPQSAHIQVRSRGGAAGGGRGAGRGAGGAPNVLPFQSIIEQLLMGLGGGAGPNQGAHPGGMPPFIFGNVMGGAGLHGNPGDYAWGPGGLDSIISQLMNQLEGSGPPAASKEQMDTLPTTQITKQQVDNGVQCSVCMEDFSLEETVRQLPCQHCFHTECIIPWLKIHGTCPVCRKTLDGQDTSCQEQSLADVMANPSSSNNQGTSTSSGGNNTGANASSSSSTQGGSANAPSTSSAPRQPPPPPTDFENEYD